MTKPGGCKFKGRKSREIALAEDLIVSCTGGGVPSETAQGAVRALCRYYGGQMVYIPKRKGNGTSAENLCRVITDAVGDRAAEEIVGKIMRLYGATQIYFPLERRAFKKIIALEIFTRVGHNGRTMNDMAREYNISVNHAYNLWREGRDEKLRPSMPYLPFLELAENNNPD
jgi:Mor family transcriptional regulator